MDAIKKRRFAAAAALAAVLAFRLALVASWHKPGGDGVQYYRMAQELRRANRLAFAPPPAPLAYSRLPAYPAFLAYAAAPGRSWALEPHVVAAVIWNVLLDLGTALLVLGILRERKLDARAGRAGFILTLACPTLWLVSCYALTETTSAFLGTLEIYLAVRALRSRPLLFAALAGVVAGVSQMMRADALTFAPGAALALLALEAPLRRRIAALALFGAAAAAAFAPWPLRNLAEFGHPYPFSSTWRRMDGTPLGDGTMAWTRTWSSSQPGEAFFDLILANNMPWDLNRPGIIMPAMYDSEAEHQRIIEIVRRYNTERLSPAVDEEFRKLADERRARAPLRFYLTLPLKRIARLWSPAPEWELPLQVRWLGLPAIRPVFGWLDRALFALALAGAVILWRRGAAARLTALICLACVGARTVLYAFAIPHGVGGRYLVEAFPLMIVLAAVSVDALAAALARRRVTSGSPSGHALSG
jgi:hypothetical protein